MKTYRVLDNSRVLNGTAEQVLEQIKGKTGRNEEINKMSVDQYARALVDNASYYLPKAAVEELNNLNGSLYDKALTVLTNSSSSGTSILSSQ